MVICENVLREIMNQISLHCQKSVMCIDNNINV